MSYYLSFETNILTQSEIYELNKNLVFVYYTRIDVFILSRKSVLRNNVHSSLQSYYLLFKIHKITNHTKLLKKILINWKDCLDIILNKIFA